MQQKVEMRGTIKINYYHLEDSTIYYTPATLSFKKKHKLLRPVHVRQPHLLQSIHSVPLGPTLHKKIW